MVNGREFLVLDVFARRQLEGNQLAVFPDAEGLTDREMQALARETHFSETTFILSEKLGPKGYPVRIFTPAREVPFAGHPTLGTAWVIWDRFLHRQAAEVKLDLAVGTVPVEVTEGEKLVMTQVPPEFGSCATAFEAAQALGLRDEDIDDRWPTQEVSTGLCFLIVPVRSLSAMNRIVVDRAAHDRLIGKMRAKAVLAFCPETVNSDCRLHVRVFCPYYDVPEDPATGSANGCLCAWLVRHRYFGQPAVDIATEQGLEMGRASQLFLLGREEASEIVVRVGGRVVKVADCRMA